jgi:cytochrome P450
MEHNNRKIPDHIPTELVFDYDIYGDPRIGSNIHEDMTFLHSSAPDIFYTPANGGHWVATRCEHIREIVQDPEVFSAREMQIPRIENPPLFIPLSLDPPHNIPFRQALMPLFSPKSVKQMESKVRHWAREIVSDVSKNGECDFVRDVSIRYPLSIFMELMGMPLERLREFRDLAESFFNAHDQETIHALSEKIIGVMSEIIDQKRQQPDEGVISYLLEVKLDEGRGLTTEEMQNLCFLLFLGGMDTVANNTGFTFRQLAGDQKLQHRLTNEPEKITDFVEEALRCFGVINTPRLVVKDIERWGVPFRNGDMILCLLPISGRDDRQNEAPNTFSIDRKKREFLTFSSGPHLCLGSFLARTEIRILTEEWLRKIPEFSAQEGPQPFRMGLGLALDSLPLYWK